jgi:hypothetical protein
MAPVLIVGMAPLLRELVRDLTLLADHSPIVVPDAFAPAVGAPHRVGEALMLDANLPSVVRDGWTRQAADLRAVIVYYASMMNERELESFARWRNAPHFALPNGPRRLAAVLGDALATRTLQEGERAGGTIDALDLALHTRLGLLATLAQARARLVIDQAAAARARSRRLRGERDVALAEAHARRDGMRETVLLMARAMRQAGASPERSLVLVRDAVSRRATTPFQLDDPDALEQETDRWVLEAFSAA